MSIAGPGIGVVKGEADGFVVRYDTTLRVKITSGIFEANGRRYFLTAGTTHTLTSLASAFDFHYILLDTSASTPQTPVFIDTITEPTFDDVRRGEYVGDDRVVGDTHSPAGSAIIEQFDTSVFSGRYIRNTMFPFTKLLALNQDPDGAFQTPNTAESSTFLPVNAVDAAIRLQNSAAGVNLILAWANNEAAAIETNTLGKPTSIIAADVHELAMWGALGASRNIKIAGEDNDNNALNAWVAGYGYRR